MPARRSGAACSIRRPARPRTDAPARARSDRKMTTIFAPSTGAPPAAIAIVRISGPDALAAARALANGRIDLAEAEGLGDLLNAETELQRRAAVMMADGALSRQIADWRSALIELAAQIEASLDFSDEADVPQALLNDIRGRAQAIAEQMRVVLAAPPVERLRDGIRVGRRV